VQTDTIHPLVVGWNETDPINPAEAYDSIQKIKAKADILIPIHALSVGRQKCIPATGNSRKER
jgi:hypothetical protein